jgi:hypothetical protein
MKYISLYSLFLLTVFMMPTLILAQVVSCPDVVRAALETTKQSCEPTGRNQACYGNSNLQAEPQANIPNFNFSKPGDLVNVESVKTLRLSPFDQQTHTWGVAIMKVQANVPDTLPGQNVTFVLFGDVEIQNASQSELQLTTVEVTAIQAVVVYQQPSEQSSILAGIVANRKVIVDGQSVDRLWLRIQLPNDPTNHGWIGIKTVTMDDFNALNVIDPDYPERLNGTQSFKPMQAFYFKTGFRDRPCAVAPDSGILIQTPENVGPIELRVNDVNVTLGSSVYLQAQPSREMVISVLEGAALLEVDGKSSSVPAGTQVRVPMNANLGVAGQASLTEPYDEPAMRVLPVQNLAEMIQVSSSLTIEQISQLGVPSAGEWTQISNVTRFCYDGFFTVVTQEIWELESRSVVDVKLNEFTVLDPPYTIRFSRSDTSDIYTGTLNNYLDSIRVDYQYHVISSELILGELNYVQDGCNYHISRQLKLIEIADSNLTG